MKFYDCVTAPSPRRVRIFLAEKGLTVPTVQVDLRNGEQFTPAFRALNPDCTVPVLELDSGVAITDIIAICRYFEELHPHPPLMGGTRRKEPSLNHGCGGSNGMESTPPRRLFENATPGLKGRALPGPVSLEQIPALAERCRLRVQHFFAWLDARLADNEFVCGPHFTIADISGMVAVDFSAWERNSRRPSISTIYGGGTKTFRPGRAPKPDFSWRQSSGRCGLLAHLSQ